ncbi:MAG: isoprenylcysteine carboxylmethyltransferase family protein [Pseudomonadota bacterium]
MGGSTLLAATGTLMIVGIAVVSATNYQHRGLPYAKGKSAGRSIRHFRFTYRYLQLCSIGVSIAALWSDAWWILEIYKNPTLTVIGLLAALCACAYFVWAKRSLGDEYSPCFDAYTPFALVTKGPYARVRHPIYTANIALLGALFMASGSLWLAFNAVVLTIYYVIAAIAEERELVDAHPDYAEYMAVSGRFLPRF